jgi:diacylglycerol kinase
MKHWIRKFTLAANGIRHGVHGQTSFIVHFPIGLAVIVLAVLLRCSLWQWCALLLCVGMVLAAELANSAIEELAAGLCREHNEHVGRALDIASGAVLLACITATTVGAIIFIAQIMAL